MEQFQRFMTVIRKLSDRVENEHSQFLRDSQRLEDRSATAPDFMLNSDTGINFESLVGRVGDPHATTNGNDNSTSWEDSIWGAILNGGAEVRSLTCILIIPIMMRP